MFAGLPGIGVGTLFYVLTALCMPFCELIVLMRGRSSVARWRLIVTQFSFAIAVVASIAVADRVMALLLEGETFTSITPARLINQGFATRAPESLFAAPIAASLLLLAVVVGGTEMVRVWLRFSAGRRRSSASDLRVTLPRRQKPTGVSPQSLCSNGVHE